MMTIMESYPNLFAPMLLGKQRFRNRIAFAAMMSVLARDGDVTPELIAFHANRAAGGASLIVTEPVSALRQAPAFGPQVRVYQRKNLGGLRRWASAVHDHSSSIVAQLQDSGRGNLRVQRKPFSLAPSSLPDDLSWTMPHAMSASEIGEVRDDFVAAARTLQLAEFDGVEISSGHGHLYHQFLSPWMNQRQDEYGGERGNRIRVLVELIDAIRVACGEGFLIGIRLPGNDGLPDSIDWDEAGRIAEALTDSCRLDYVNFVHGTHAWTLHTHVPDLHAARGTYVEDIGRLRSHCNGVPVASTGRIVEPVQAEALLAAGKADFVMLGRALLADPAWGLKARQNRDGDIRKCVSSNHCWGHTVLGNPIACDNNPRVAKADEVDWWPKRASKKRRITVVGGGIAGLETAWVAAARGHHVTLFSQSAELGGKARLYAAIPGCEAASSIFDYQITAVQRAEVDCKPSHKASLEDIIETDPAVVVLATGGEMMWPTQLPREWRDWGIIPNIWSAIADLGRMRADSGAAVIFDFDGTDVTYSAAEALSRIYARVVIISPVECLARDEALVRRQSVYHRLLTRGIETMQWSEPSPKTDLEAGQVVVRNLMSGRETTLENVSLFVYSTPKTPNDELLIPLRNARYKTHVIGDACIPRSTMATLREAHDLAESL